MATALLSSAAGSADKPAFQWQRFWVPRTGSIDLSDGGFLTDPTHPLRSGGIGAQQLAELAEYRALVLLGEPGIGKSTTLLEEAARLGAQATDGTISIHADLRTYSSESLLHKRVFESAEFMAWANGESHLVLHLDSLDEALLRIDSIANLLADEIPRHPTSRLSVRIACRTAVWPSATLEPALRSIWGDAAVGVLELAPLRRRDVVAAAEATGLDAESFLRQVHSANAVPFAIKPLTLRRAQFEPTRHSPAWNLHRSSAPPCSMSYSRGYYVCEPICRVDGSRR
jgi:predicted NACHT family NTPase